MNNIYLFIFNGRSHKRFFENINKNKNKNLMKKNFTIFFYRFFMCKVPSYVLAHN